MGVEKLEDRTPSRDERCSLTQNEGDDFEEDDRHVDCLRLEIEDFGDDCAESCKTEPEKESSECERVVVRVVRNVCSS